MHGGAIKRLGGVLSDERGWRQWLRLCVCLVLQARGRADVDKRETCPATCWQTGMCHMIKPQNITTHPPNVYDSALVIRMLWWCPRHQSPTASIKQNRLQTTVGVSLFGGGTDEWIWLLNIRKQHKWNHQIHLRCYLVHIVHQSPPDLTLMQVHWGTT